jgi:hypothetical protein
MLFLCAFCQLQAILRQDVMVRCDMSLIQYKRPASVPV